MNLSERLIAWAQNEEMIDSHFTEHGKDCLESARLIAAAPDLLAALEDLLTEAMVDESEQRDMPARQKQVRAAIAKARGQ